MSLSIVYSRALSGIQAPLVTVETDLILGMPSFSIVGLPEKAVKESKDRVRSALLNTYFDFPVRKITVNLAPADLPKEGGRFDLPIALGILASHNQLSLSSLAEYEFAGELALSGELRPIQGVLPFALATKKANKKLIVPIQNANEASFVKDLQVFPAKHISDVCNHLNSQNPLERFIADKKAITIQYHHDLSDVRGQKTAKRALEIAAAGGHSLLLEGPPGTGKTMLASRMPTILAEMSDQEAIESAAIASISHQGFSITNWKKRFFRAPHHSASSVALVGGGNPPKPGEISLAHQGVLFLDELPEFNRHVLEALREPLESGTITISRAARQNEFPASFQFIAAMNPCPCGYLGDPQHNCRCTADQIQRYHTKISGPILDRIDMFIKVPRIPANMIALQNVENSESSKIVRARVNQARIRQMNRANKMNAKLNNKELETYCLLEKEQQELLDHAVQKFNLSARTYHRLLKVALTISDLDQAPKIKHEHLSEALMYRNFRN